MFSGKIDNFDFLGYVCADIIDRLILTNTELKCEYEVLILLGMESYYFGDWRFNIFPLEEFKLWKEKRKSSYCSYLKWVTLFPFPEICSHIMFLWARGWQKWNLSCQRSNARISLQKIFRTAAMSSSRCAVF